MSDVRPGYKRTEAGVIPNEWEASRDSQFVLIGLVKTGNYARRCILGGRLSGRVTCGMGKIDLRKIWYFRKGL